MPFVLDSVPVRVERRLHGVGRTEGALTDPGVLHGALSSGRYQHGPVLVGPVSPGRYQHGPVLVGPVSPGRYQHGPVLVGPVSPGRYHHGPVLSWSGLCLQIGTIMTLSCPDRTCVFR